MYSYCYEYSAPNIEEYPINEFKTHILFNENEEESTYVMHLDLQYRNIIYSYSYFFPHFLDKEYGLQTVIPIAFMQAQKVISLSIE